MNELQKIYELETVWTYQNLDLRMYELKMRMLS